MEVVYTGENMPYKFSKSLFLCGPSLRPGQDKEMESWRKDAIEILRDKGFDGVVFIPENRSFKATKDFDYADQIEWEDKYLNVADCILFWVPRDLSLDKEDNPKLPAFTTNVEFGFHASDGRVVFGCPEGAEKVDYLKYYADKFNVPVSDTLVSTIDDAMEMLGDGAERYMGERYVPLFIWKTPSFQSWYHAQCDAGNRLEDARLLYTFRPGFKDFVFLWVLKASVYVASEDRYKDNEFVMARPDISSVCLWRDTGDSLFETEVVIVKEFRTPAATNDGFIRELPGGSSQDKTIGAEETAAEEMHEEVGMYIEPSRFIKVSSRQLAGTLSAHQSHLYSVKLSEKEMDWFKSQKGVVYGKQEDTERTYIEVFSISEILENRLLDWANLGMILAVIAT